jgi:hypothetical protein
LRLARGTHQLPHLAYGNAARRLGHAAGISGHGADRVLRPVSKAWVEQWDRTAQMTLTWSLRG